MRAIIFRGRNLITGEWVTGDLFQHEEQRFIMADNRNTEVIPETVGQFIGALDKNGKKIFEGDRILINGSIYEVKYLDECASFTGYKSYSCVVHLFASVKTEIIGNIHEYSEDNNA